MKRTFITAAAILAFAAPAAHADELTDVQAQAKQLREQMTKRLADLEKRQKALEAQQKAVPTISPVDAMAADLPYKAAVKAKPVENDDICVKGICVYGNFDMGFASQTHGAPYSAFAGGPLDYAIQKNSSGSYSGVAANLMSTSFIGLRGKQEIGDNLYAVFNLQTLFNPASGMNANGTGSLVQNNGLGGATTIGTLTNAYGDSSKGGQLFNNAAYFGISSPTYGTFTMGRQSSLTSDLVVNYDALSGSNAWSLITYEGATGGGGVTENRILDNSYEYRLNVGPVRLAAEAQLRNGGNSATGNAFLGDVGFDYMGFSMDVVGGKVYDALSVGAPLSSSQVGALTTSQSTGTNPITGTAITCSLGCMSGTISDDTIFQIAARYTIGPWKFYGGYEHLWFDNPNNPLSPGAFAQGGYNLAYVNNNNYLSTRNQDAFWVGVKYAITPALDIIGSYYGIRQHFFQQGASPGTAVFANTPGGAANLGSVAAQQAACAANSASQSNCNGGEDMVSLVVDWRFARHVDVFAGVAYSQRNGGLANGFATSNNNGLATTTTGTTVGVSGICATCATTVSSWNPGVGLRYQF
ncbi:porin [Bradyrhizobium erythrophlei]|uniref:Outer membrane protein (Porin) n=1 Tax=Bradyrhizobium erythrophlei TaxID=1437360 RepID=A0A1M7TQ65_9BRAD|nr:porin [Bradyrhizobium erythrophlei]SHN72798.1 Outer membrane protein (porin) [Bradyrhizobium erythrophlei]